MALQIRDTTWYRHANLKAYYPFFNTGSGYTPDRSGNSHDLTEIGDPAYVVTGSKVGFARATYLYGDDGFSITDHADLKPTGDFSVGFWVRTANVTSQPVIFQSYAYGTYRAGFIVQITSLGYVTFRIALNNGGTEGTHYKTITGNVDVSDNSWHFVVCVWDGAKMYVYIDGVADTDASWTHAPVYQATNYVRVGCYSIGAAEDLFLTGYLDDVFLLNGTALSAVQVKRIYDGKKGSGLLPFFTHWKNN
jgi:hypothetical protein